MRRILFFAVAHIALAPSSTAQTVMVGRSDREIVSIRSDRATYLAGETVWYKVHCQTVDATDVASDIAYVDLTNSDGQVVSSQKVDLRGERTGIVDLPDSLSTGWYVLAAYTHQSNVQDTFNNVHLHITNTFKRTVGLPEFTVYRPKGDIDNSYQISMNEESVGRRQPVNFTIQHPSKGEGLSLDMSVSVYRTGEGGQTVWSSYPPFLNDNEKISVHWNAETNGQVVSGTIRDAVNGHPLSVPVYISVVSKVPRFYCVQSENGVFTVELRHYSGPANIVFQAACSNYVISIDNPLKAHLPTPAEPTKGHDVAVSSEMVQVGWSNLHKWMQVWQAYYADSLKSGNDVVTDTLETFGQSDESVRLDDYTRFNTFEEVFREFIKTVMVRKHGDTLHLMTLNNIVALSQNPKFFDSDPLVLVDGVPIFDNIALFALDPLKIQRVEVLAKTYFFGPLSFTGVISLHTYKNDLGELQLPKAAVVMDYPGTENSPRFYFPKYDRYQNNTVPDTRTVLFWQPTIQLNSQGVAKEQFFSGDIPGRYEIVLQGRTKEGKDFWASKSFVVQ